MGLQLGIGWRLGLGLGLVRVRGSVRVQMSRLELACRHPRAHRPRQAVVPPHQHGALQQLQTMLQPVHPMARAAPG